MDPSTRIPSHQLGLVANEQPFHEMERAELKVIDRERTVLTLVKKEKDPLPFREGWRSGQAAGHMDLHERFRISLDRLLECHIRHRLGAGLRKALDMRPQHAADDDCARALDLEPVGRDHIRDRAQIRGQQQPEERENERA